MAAVGVDATGQPAACISFGLARIDKEFHTCTRTCVSTGIEIIRQFEENIFNRGGWYDTVQWGWMEVRAPAPGSLPKDSTGAPTCEIEPASSARIAGPSAGSVRVQLSICNDPSQCSSGGPVYVLQAGVEQQARCHVSSALAALFVSALTVIRRTRWTLTWGMQ